MTQHYVALGVLLAFDARHFLLLFGPELGYLAHARFAAEGPTAVRIYLKIYTSACGHTN